MVKRITPRNTISCLSIGVALVIGCLLVKIVFFPLPPKWDDRLREQQEGKLESMDQLEQRLEEERKDRIKTLLESNQ